MASPTQWTWVWANSGSWWWTGRPGVLRSLGSQESGTTEGLNWTVKLRKSLPISSLLQAGDTDNNQINHFRCKVLKGHKEGNTASWQGKWSEMAFHKEWHLSKTRLGVQAEGTILRELSLAYSTAGGTRVRVSSIKISLWGWWARQSRSATNKSCPRGTLSGKHTTNGEDGLKKVKYIPLISYTDHLLNHSILG